MKYIQINKHLHGEKPLQKKYTVYNALRLSLGRNNFVNPSKLATYLLNVFVDGKGKIRSSEVYSLGLCDSDEKEFKEWRKLLSDEGWIEFTIESNRYIQYRAGKKLLKYINKEKFQTRELATKDDLLNHTMPLEEKLDQKADKETVEELFATKEEVEELRATLNRVVNIIDPPDSPQKRKKLMQGGYDSHLKLTQKFDDSQ